MPRAVPLWLGLWFAALLTGEFNVPSASASDQFAVIRPQLQFDVADPWAIYPRGTSTALLAGNRGSRWSRGPSSEARLGAKSATSSKRGRRSRQPSPFEATGAAPLTRDLPAAERTPPPTRRRPLGW